MVLGEGEGGKYADPVQGVKDSYNRGVTDEFIVRSCVLTVAPAGGHNS